MNRRAFFAAVGGTVVGASLVQGREVAMPPSGNVREQLLAIVRELHAKGLKVSSISGSQKMQDLLIESTPIDERLVDRLGRVILHGQGRGWTVGWIPVSVEGFMYICQADRRSRHHHDSIVFAWVPGSRYPPCEEDYYPYELDLGGA